MKDILIHFLNFFMVISRTFASDDHLNLSTKSSFLHCPCFFLLYPLSPFLTPSLVKPFLPEKSPKFLYFPQDFRLSNHRNGALLASSRFSEVHRYSSCPYFVAPITFPFDTYPNRHGVELPNHDYE